MDTDELLDVLKYSDSPYFLEPSRLMKHPGYAHAFRQAQKFCSEDGAMRGAYVLSDRPPKRQESASIIPVIYVCEAGSEDEAREIHRAVWNQNLAPFLLVETPKYFRIYRGFSYDEGKSQDPAKRKDQTLIKVLKESKDVLDKLSDFSAESIDTGLIWDRRSKEITHDKRVDWNLLKYLNKLGAWLLENNVSRNTAHSLIGKYVYLRYLRDRDIVSDRKLDEWKIKESEVFGRDARLDAFYHIDDELNDWLNGSVFPLSDNQRKELKQYHLQEVAGTFSGDEPAGQLYLNFKRYDFRHIPIETLSVVYQQFLHSQGKGKKQGAYYTPLHLVNFMLDELETKKRLEKGVRVFDPSAGSGAFLVQSYRRMIERELAANGGELKPSQLKSLLLEHIYGLDIDEDACGIAELSLIITLLDYVDPPDLKKYHNFKLPALRDNNIFHADFFDTEAEWNNKIPTKGFELIVGNPPWKGLNPKKLDYSENLSYCWMVNNREKYPVANNQLAEVFSWKVSEHISHDGSVGLLMPATSLFNKSSHNYRAKFFSTMKAWCVVNFSNIRRYLFRGAIKPAAAFYYSPCEDYQKNEGNGIITYSPFSINQLIPKDQNKRQSWSVVIESSVIREVPLAEVCSGELSNWKIAMWGTISDANLLKTISKRYPILSEFLDDHDLYGPSAGPELREKDSEEHIELIKEVIGKKELIIEELRGCGKIFSFPSKALRPIDKEKAFFRMRGGKKGFSVCKPPHIIIDAARRFSVYSDQFIVIPPRQLGISGSSEDSNILKALSMYLSSDYATYHQFLKTGIWGVERDRPDLGDLKKIPVPINDLKNAEIKKWVRLHGKLVDASISNQDQPQTNMFASRKGNGDLKKLLDELNDRVYDLLGIDYTDRYLVEDMVHVKMGMIDGRMPDDVIRPASEDEMLGYAKVLKSELDDFLDMKNKDQHQVTVFHDGSAIIKVVRKAPAGKPRVLKADGDVKKELDRIQDRHLKDRRQWGYFNRGLKIYDGNATYLFKPRHRLYWLKSQALNDADDFIADKLSASGDGD